EKFDSRGFPFNRPIASAQTATVKYLVQFFTDDGAHERTRQRPEDNDLIEPIYELRAKSLPHDPQHLVFGKDCGAGSETDLRAAMAGRAEIGGEDDEAVPEICDPTAGIRQPAIVENLQKQIPDIGMRFLELVKKNDSKGLFSDPLDERVGVRPIAIAAENSGRRFSRLKLAHVETSHAIGRTEEKLSERLGQLGFASSGRSHEEKDADRTPRIHEARLQHGNPVDDRIDSFALAHDARGQ